MGDRMDENTITESLIILDFLGTKLGLISKEVEFAVTNAFEDFSGKYV